ncbi:MAG: aldo/keto reductase [Kiritimatiellae bacterium]|nr:aldo/keto reductase [Kiritimatiellia bacterium]
MSPGHVPRRDFLKILLAAGAGSLLRPWAAGAADDAPGGAPSDQVPGRPFGKTGVQVACLGLGGMFDILNNQLLLRRAHQLGVTYWDTADCYEGGRGEPGFGKYFAANPEARKDIFLVTKSDARDPAGITRLLNRSLERLQTDYIDLYFIHGVRNINELNNDTKDWVERAKREGKIRFFGFSTHSNMENCLRGAAKLGWVDGIMLTYNYRLMHEDNMKRAVEACTRAGIGLTAMKTQGGGSVRTDSEDEMALAGRFLGRGFSAQQAKLKAVWENPQIASICSQMPSMKVLMANVAAAMDRTKLSRADHEALEQHAAATRCGYCAGCAGTCSALAQGAPVQDVMRCLMYYHSYGERGLARSEFAALPPDARARLASADFSAAERACPQRMAIGRLMREAHHILA